MKVTPVSKKFGKYKPGEEFELPDKAAKVFVRAGKLRKVESTYQTRMMTAAAPMQAEAPEPQQEAVDAPYGYKADGTPRKRPGRPAASE